jgi:hypothetical protein
VLTRFPGAQIVDVRERAAQGAEEAPEAGILGEPDADATRETESDE